MKLDLNELKVKSFVTSTKEISGDDILGGISGMRCPPTSPEACPTTPNCPVDDSYGCTIVFTNACCNTLQC